MLGISPLNTFEQKRHLTARQLDRAVDGRGPDEASMVQSFCIKRQPNPIMPDRLNQPTTTPPEDIDIAGEGQSVKMFLDQQGKSSHAFPHIEVTCGNPDFSARTDGDHRKLFMIAETSSREAPAPMLTRAPILKSTVIKPVPDSDPGPAGPSASIAGLKETPLLAARN